MSFRPTTTYFTSDVLKESAFRHGLLNLVHKSDLSMDNTLNMLMKKKSLIDFLGCEIEKNEFLKLYHADSGLERYRAKIISVLVEAGSFPLHCVYDRRRYLANECYINQQGITVSISLPEKGCDDEKAEVYQVRTAYRPRQGKYILEKYLEALDGVFMDGMAFNAVIDFDKFLNQKNQCGIIHERYTGESWIRMK